MPKSDLRLAPLAFLAVLLALGAVLLYRAPVHRYVVACERTAQVTCVLEQENSAGVQRWRVPLGPGTSAQVRIMPQRRGPARVLLYLVSPAQAVFAAEFEGGDAAYAAGAAAVQLNRVLRDSTLAAARIEAEPPPILRWAAWATLVVMALVIGAGYQKVRSQAPIAESIATVAAPAGARPR